MHVRTSRALICIVFCSAYRGPFGSGPVGPRTELGSECLLHLCVPRVQLDLSYLVLRIRDLPGVARYFQYPNRGAQAQTAFLLMAGLNLENPATRREALNIDSLGPKFGTTRCINATGPAGLRTDKNHSQ
jgi:hypothetical protein